LVLSVCSDYFDALFQQLPDKFPCVVLKDVKAEDLEALLSYMYIGEVSVNQADLGRLVKAAEVLCIKGLAPHEPQPHIYTDTNVVREAKGQQIFATSNGNVVTFMAPANPQEIHQQATFRTRHSSGPSPKRRRKDDTQTGPSIISSSAGSTIPQSTVIDATVTVDEATSLVYQDDATDANNPLGVSVEEISVVGSNSRGSPDHHLKEVQGHSLLQVQ